MLKLHVTSSRFCLYLLNIYHFTYTFFCAHTEAHTHKHICTISTQKEWRQTGTGAWLRGAEIRLCWPCTNKKKSQKKPIFNNLKKTFEHIELPAKLLDYFLRSNKSNINHTHRDTHTHTHTHIYNILETELRKATFFSSYFGLVEATSQ